MIDPRTTNLIGQLVLIRRRSIGSDLSESAVIGRGLVRVVDNQQGCFTLLIEAVGTVDLYGGSGLDDGSLFQVSLYDETIDLVVDREGSSPKDPLLTDPIVDALEEALGDHTGTLRMIDVCRILRIEVIKADRDVIIRLDRALRALGWEPLHDRAAYGRGTPEQREAHLRVEPDGLDGLGQPHVVRLSP